jgi:dihydrofolate reductase
MFFDVVVACDRAGGIAKDGKIPWHLPEELQWFKKVTSHTQDPDKQNAVIMGRKTWESLPERARPLKGRVNVVLSRDENYAPEGDAWGALSFEDALQAIDHGDFGCVETVFVIGGGEVYKEAFDHPSCRLIIMSGIPETFDCDTFIRVPDRFETVETRPHQGFKIWWLTPKELTQDD